ncbi:MAG: hypothetical protein KAT37_03640 [Candidatus Aenigmarchaeota archaeon]|nr:hypothetical protein [Candidatus Aenigmarchaeota archaeon]
MAMEFDAIGIFSDSVFSGIGGITIGLVIGFILGFLVAFFKYYWRHRHAIETFSNR